MRAERRVAEAALEAARAQFGRTEAERDRLAEQLDALGDGPRVKDAQAAASAKAEAAAKALAEAEQRRVAAEEGRAAAAERRDAAESARRQRPRRTVRGPGRA